MGRISAPPQVGSEPEAETKKPFRVAVSTDVALREIREVSARRNNIFIRDTVQPYFEDSFSRAGNSNVRQQRENK